MARALRYSATMSLPAVRDQHLQLLQDWAQLDVQAKQERATELRHRAVDLGYWLQDPFDRDAAQGIVDYWTSALASVPGQAFPDLLRLAEFDTRAGPAVEAQALAVYDALTPEQRDLAGELFLELLGAPAEPKDAERDLQFDEVRRRFIEAGVIVRGPGDDGLAIAHKALLAANWPQLDDWIAERALDDALAQKLEKSAILWKRYGKADDLLRGNALSQALPYRGHPKEEVAAFIDASVRDQTRRRVTFAAANVGVAAGVLFLAGSLVRTVKQNDGLEGRVGTLKDDLATSQKNLETTQDNLAQVVPEAGEAAPEAQVVATSEQPGLEGYIWIGNTSQQLLRKFPSGDRVTPTVVAKGSFYRARANIALRKGYPDTNYDSAPQSGIVGVGAMLEALDNPVAFSRPSGAQYWLHVRQAITVNIQYRGSPARAEALRQRLGDLGYDAPPVENRDASRTPVAEIRYYQSAERPFAVRLKADLAQALAEAGQKTGTSCKLFTSIQPDRPYRLEIWVDFTAKPIPDTACPS